MENKIIRLCKDCHRKLKEGKKIDPNHQCSKPMDTETLKHLKEDMKEIKAKTIDAMVYLTGATNQPTQIISEIISEVYGHTITFKKLMTLIETSPLRDGTYHDNKEKRKELIIERMLE